MGLNQKTNGQLGLLEVKELLLAPFSVKLVFVLDGQQEITCSLLTLMPHSSEKTTRVLGFFFVTLLIPLGRITETKENSRNTV